MADTATMEDILIEVKNMKYIYNSDSDDETVALRDVSFTVKKGEFIAVIGRNGSGKSTLARVLNALYEPDAGEVLVKGYSTTDKKRILEIRSTVGVVFQNPENQMVMSIIEDDVAFGPENLGIKREEIEERVTKALMSVGMEHRRKGTPFRLSGGQKQRIAIAGVLAMNPEVIILDESTAMLDPRGRKDVLGIVKELQQSGTSVLLITHFPEEAALAERTIVLDGGTVVRDGPSEEILSDVPFLESLGLEAPIPAKVAYALKMNGMDIGNVITGEKLGEAVKCLLK